MDVLVGYEKNRYRNRNEDILFSRAVVIRDKLMATFAKRYAAKVRETKCISRYMPRDFYHPIVY